MVPPMPAVLVTRRMPSAVLAQLDAVGESDLHTGPDDLTHEALCARLRGKQGIICVFTDRIDAAVIAAGDQLRVIATVAVGFDNIDVTAAATRGIVVTNTPNVLTGATAELTWALILAVTRRLGEGERVIRRGAWPGWTFDFMLGTELRGKQRGSIGAGRSGRAVAAVAPAFGMRAVCAARPGGDVSGPETAADVLPLDQLLLSSDVVSLHVPMRAETRHLIDRRALAAVDDPERSVPWLDTGRFPHDGDPMSARDLKLLLDAAEAAGLRRFNYHHQGNLSAGEWVVISDKCGSRWDPRRSAWEPSDELVL